MPKSYPPFELQTTASTLARLADGITGVRIVAVGTSINAVWLRDAAGRIALIAADQRDVRPMFEVFALSIRTLEELHERWRGWTVPAVHPSIPEEFRRLFTTRPPEPVAPTDFAPWPFEAARIDVLRRAEFIVEDVEMGPTFGAHPNAQSAAGPGHVPDEASASCEVAVGLLFTGPAGQRALIGVDWAPMTLVFAQAAAEIDAYLALCDRIALPDYAART